MRNSSKAILGFKKLFTEGSESLIPLVEMAIERGASQDIQDVVMAMAPWQAQRSGEYHEEKSAKDFSGVC